MLYIKIIIMQLERLSPIFKIFDDCCAHTAAFLKPLCSKMFRLTCVFRGSGFQKASCSLLRVFSVTVMHA